jgi:hypothetical protein
MSALLIWNDRNERVLPVGVPGSVERAQCQWPRVIAALQRSQAAGRLNRNSAGGHFARANVVLIEDKVACLMAVGLSRAAAEAMGGATFR